jgi:ribosomal protein S18 acetylase RimI-like enzyme
MDYVIHPLTDADEPLLWEMLYHGLHAAEAATKPSQDIVRRPELARYVAGWGRPGDTGFVARDPETGDPLGAVWFRLPIAEESGAQNKVTPELAFAVKPGHRRRGIGAALLTQWVKTNPQQSSISIAVAATSPAVRLYERFGFKVVRENPGSVTMGREI